MGDSGKQVKITYFPDSTDLSVSIIKKTIRVSTDGWVRKGEIKVTDDELQQISERISNSLANLCNHSGNSLEVNTCTHELRELAEKGYLLFKRLFRKENLREDIANYLLKNDNKIIEIHTDGIVVPWNLLYLENPTGKEINPCKFLAMRHIIRVNHDTYSDSGGSLLESGEVNDKPSLGLIHLAESDLYAVDTHEIPFFDKLSKEDKIKLSKLEELDNDGKLKDDQLNKVKGFFKCQHDILHFACHAYFDPQDNGKSYLLVSKEFYLTLSDIELLELDNINTSLTFLNACEVANVFGYIHIAGTFYEHGARSVIGAQSWVNDELAAEFMKYFYEELLKGSTVGWSLLLARRKMWKQRENLLGLLYDLYGASGTRIFRQRNTNTTKGVNHE